MTVEIPTPLLLALLVTWALIGYGWGLVRRQPRRPAPALLEPLPTGPPYDWEREGP